MSGQTDHAGVAWSGRPDDDAQTLTRTANGAIVGTPASMAPEQVAGGGADARTDIHGAGCVLHQMLTGNAPFGSGSPSEVMRRGVVTPPKPLRTLRSGVPRALAGAVEKALAKDPSNRYQSAAELGAEVCRFAGVRALLEPQIHAAGEIFILQAMLVDPTTGWNVDRIRLTARDRDEVLLETIDELTRTVRRRLGESLQSIADNDPPISRCTTSSREALQLHALGMEEWAASRMAEAARCFEAALEMDPDFAFARGSLGLVDIQFLSRHEEARALLSAAAPGSDTVGQGLVVAAATSSLVGDTAGALSALEGAIAAGYNDPYFLLIDPLLEAVRDDPALDRLAPVS